MDIIRCNEAGDKIKHAEKKLLVYHCIGKQNYDRPKPFNPNQLTKEDFGLANQLGARIKPEYWQPLVGKDISAIREGLDLIEMSEAEWSLFQQDIEKCLATLLIYPGIACATLTKALHRKRPTLIPVCDSEIIKYMLGGQDPDYKSASTIIKTMSEFRKDGIKNKATLSEMSNFLVNQCGKPNLTTLRMLEKLYWMENVRQYKELWPEMERQGWWK
jgi:hypothetical protein